MHKSKVTVGTSMKRTVTIGLLGAILAITVGFISTNAISATPFLMAASDLSSDESLGMIGHVEYTVLDSNGQIKQYIQGDNLIVDKGRNCAAILIFDNSSSTPDCTISPGTTGFNVIAIGNGTSPAPGNNDLQLVDEMQRTPGVVTISEPADGTTIVEVTTEAPFTFNHGTTNHPDGITIEESGLFDDMTAGGGNMFSNRVVGNIEVSSADTLAVTWTITITGTPP
jgi:hypothetical protein